VIKKEFRCRKAKKNTNSVKIDVFNEFITEFAPPLK